MHEATKAKIQEIKDKSLFPFSQPFTFTITITNMMFIVISPNQTFIPYPWYYAVLFFSFLWMLKYR